MAPDQSRIQLFIPPEVEQFHLAFIWFALTLYFYCIELRLLLLIVVNTRELFLPDIVTKEM